MRVRFEWVGWVLIVLSFILISKSAIILSEMQEEPEDSIGQRQKDKFKQIAEMKENEKHRFHSYLQKLEHNGIHIIQTLTHLNEVFKYQQTSSCSYLKDYQQYQIEFSYFSLTLQTYQITLPLQVNNQLEQYLFQVNGLNYQLFPCNSLNKNNILLKATLHKILRILLQQQSISISKQDEERDAQTELKTNNYKIGKDKCKFDLIWDTENYNIWLPVAKTDIFFYLPQHDQSDNAKFCQLEQIKLYGPQGKSLSQLAQFLSVVQTTQQLCYQCIDNQLQKEDRNKQYGTLYITMTMYKNCLNDKQLNSLYENMLNPANSIIETRNNKISYYVPGKIVKNMEQPPIFTQISAMFDILAQFYLNLNFQSVMQLYDANFADVAKNNHILLRNLLCTMYYNLDKSSYQAYRNSMLKAWQQKPEQVRQKQGQIVKAECKVSTRQKSWKPSNNLGMKLASEVVEGERSVSIKKINEINQESEQSYGGSSCQQIFNQDKNFDDFSADQQIEGNLVTIDKKRREKGKAEFEINAEYQFLFKDTKNGKMKKQIQQRSKLKKLDSEIQRQKQRVEKTEEKRQKQRQQLKEVEKEDYQEQNGHEKDRKEYVDSLGNKQHQNSAYLLDKKQLFKQIRRSKQKLWNIPNSLWLIGTILLNEDAVQVFQFIKYLSANFGNYYHNSAPKWLFSNPFIHSFVTAVFQQLQQSLGMNSSSQQHINLKDEQLSVAWLYLNYAILVYIRYDMKSHQPDWQRITSIKQALQKQTTKIKQSIHRTEHPPTQHSSNEQWRKIWIYCLRAINKNISYKLECQYKDVKNRDEKLTTIIQLLDKNIKYLNVMFEIKIRKQNIGQLYHFIAVLHVYSSLAEFFHLAKFRDHYVWVFDIGIPSIVIKSLSFLDQYAQSQNQHDSLFACNIVLFRAILADSIDESLFMGQYFRQSQPNQLKAITNYAIISKLSQGWMFKLQNPFLLHPHPYRCKQHIKQLGQILHHKEYLTYSSILVETRQQRIRVGQACQQCIQKILDSLKQEQKRIKESMKMKMKMEIRTKQQKYSIFHQYQYFTMLYLIAYLYSVINSTTILYEYRTEIEDLFIQLAQIGRQLGEHQRITAVMIIIKDGRRVQRIQDVNQLIQLIANQLLLSIQSATQQPATRWPNFSEQGPKLEKMFKKIQAMKTFSLPQLNQLTNLLQQLSQQIQKLMIFVKLRVQFSQLSQFNQYLIGYGRNMEKNEQYGERLLKLLSTFPLGMARYEESSIKYSMRILYPHNKIFLAKTPLLILQQLYKKRIGNRSVTLVCQYIQALYRADNQKWIDVLEEVYSQSIVARKSYQHVWIRFVEFLPTRYPHRFMANHVNTFAKFNNFQLTHSLTKNNTSFFIYGLGIEYLKSKKTVLDSFDAHFTFLKWLCIAFRQSKHLLTTHKRKTLSATLHSITAQVYRLKNHRKSKLHYKKFQKHIKNSQPFIFRAPGAQNTNTYHKIHRLYQKHSEQNNNLTKKKLYKLLCAKCCENCYNQTYPKKILARMVEKVRNYQRVGQLDRTV